MKKFFVFALVFIATQAIENGHREEHRLDYYTEPHYSFEYEVKDTHTGDIKSHKEERKGDHTQGVYSLIEPDGSKRIVEYIVEGESGFNAKVQRDPSKHFQSYRSGGYNSEGDDRQSEGDASGGYGGEDIPSYQSHGSLGYDSQGIFSSHGRLANGYGGENGAGVGGGDSSSSSNVANGDATSSVRINTHGAKVYTSTKHIIPETL